jgi:hypothetical protein
VKRIVVLVACALVAQPSFVLAKTPRNPDRLAKIVDCESARRELIPAAQGSPLRSAEKNRDYLARVVELADRLCTDANPSTKPTRQ